MIELEHKLFFNVVDEEQPNSLLNAPKVTWDAEFEEDMANMIGFDKESAKKEMEQVVRLELSMSLNEEILKMIRNSVDAFDINFITLDSQNVKGVIPNLTFDGNAIVASPNIVALIERLRNFKLDDSPVDMSSHTIGIGNVGKADGIDVYRDVMALKDYILTFEWDQNPIVDVHIKEDVTENGKREFTCTMSDVDMEKLNPSLTIFNFDINTFKAFNCNAQVIW